MAESGGSALSVSVMPGGLCGEIPGALLPVPDAARDRQTPCQEAAMRGDDRPWVRSCICRAPACASGRVDRADERSGRSERALAKLILSAIGGGELVGGRHDQHGDSG